LLAGVGLLVVAVVVALVVVTRGGEEADEVVATPTTTVAPTTTSTVPPVLAPLTGLAVDEAVAARQALVIKIDNAEGLARPQAGINQADVVIEEKVEGNISRFFAVYQSTSAPSVGPVRSARSTDIALVGELANPLFAYSGANDIFLGLLAGAPMVDVGYNRAEQAYQRVGERKAPHNLFTSTDSLWELVSEGALPPPPFATFRAEGADAPASALPATSVGFLFGSGGARVEYRWDAASGTWGRWQHGTPHVDTDDVQVAPVNVIVQFVPYVNSGARDGIGNPVPEAETVGSGEALVFLDGVVVGGGWQRSAADQMTTFTDASGAPIELRAGRTWIALVPVGTPVDIA
jgi:hypothetical protein